MSGKKDLTHQASIWISHLAHAWSCVTLWPSSSELEMLFQMLGPNGHFLRSHGKPASFGNKFKLFFPFPLLRWFWNTAPKRCGLPSQQGANKKGKTEAKPELEGLGSGIWGWWFLRFLVSPPVPLPFPPSLCVGANCHGKQRLLS